MNILIVGLGSIALKHITAIRQIENESVIYALRRNNNSENMEGIVNIYSINELNNDKIDFAIISNPTSEHIKTINLLVTLKCPLFIEKPLSNTMEANITVQTIKQLNILTYIACNLRFLECIKYIKNYLTNNKKRINEINVYCGSFLPNWRANVNFRESYSVMKEKGGGVNLDLIHEIDYIYWFFGKPINTIKKFRNKSSLNIDANDYANFYLEYDNFSVSIILNYYRNDTKRTMEILFEDETWLVDLIKNNIISNGNVIFNSTQQIPDTYLEQMKYFFELINKNALSSFNTIEDAFEVLKIGI